MEDKKAASFNKISSYGTVEYMIVEIDGKDLKPVLMKGASLGVKIPFYRIEDNQQVIFVVTSGSNGSEFNKTIGYFSTFNIMQTYQCLYGQGILVMQRNDESGEAKEFKVVSLTPGRQILVPSGWGMCLVNTSTNYLVVLRNSALEKKYEEVEPIIEKEGLAYFVVEKKGEIGFEENPTYKLHPQITTE